MNIVTIHDGDTTFFIALRFYPDASTGSRGTNPSIPAEAVSDCSSSRFVELKATGSCARGGAQVTIYYGCCSVEEEVVAQLSRVGYSLRVAAPDLTGIARPRAQSRVFYLWQVLLRLILLFQRPIV